MQFLNNAPALLLLLIWYGLKGSEENAETLERRPFLTSLAGRVLRVGKKKKDNYKMPKKIYWHLYSLQTLNTEKFVSVVNKILKNEFYVIK